MAYIGRPKLVSYRDEVVSRILYLQRGGFPYTLPDIWSEEAYACSPAGSIKSCLWIETDLSVWVNRGTGYECWGNKPLYIRSVLACPLDRTSPLTGSHHERSG